MLLLTCIDLIEDPKTLFEKECFFQSFYIIDIALGTPVKHFQSFYGIVQLPFDLNWVKLNGDNWIQSTLHVRTKKCLLIRTRKKNPSLVQNKYLFSNIGGTESNPLRNKSTKSLGTGETAAYLKDSRILSKIGALTPI